MRVVIFAALAAFAFFATSCSKSLTPDAATKAFFDEVASGNTGKAYESGAFAFRAQQSQKFFETTLKELGLHEITDASYTPAEMEEEGRTAKVKAELTTKSGSKVPLVVTLTQESGTWKVFALKSPRSRETGLVDNPFSIVGRGPDFVEPVQRQPVPEEAVCKTLVQTALLDFNDCVQRGDFTELFEKCSLAWQDQLVTGEVARGIPNAMRIALTERQKEIGASRLQRAFQPFIDKKVNLAGIEKVELTFDNPPRVTNDGLLIITGVYPTEPYRVIFSMKFTYELPKWKLFGLDVSLRK